MDTSYTVGKLAARYGLSRSTLLYYDSIGLLKPAKHVKGEYRIYGEAEAQRLELICRYRKAGITLKDIASILNSPKTSLFSILEKRFAELNREIDDLREQQTMIASILGKTEVSATTPVMNKKRWVTLLESAGYDEEDMRRWHVLFEKTDPGGHLDFLRFLQIDSGEIAKIRSWANFPE